MFKNFQENKISSNFGHIYEQVLSTVGTAHEKNKKTRTMQEKELQLIRDQNDTIQR